MIELVKSPVVFIEDTHTYIYGDKVLHGITGMISRQLFPDKYTNIPELVLKRAAERGSLVHSQCQFADVTGFEPESIEAKNYIDLRTNAGYYPVANEYTVSDLEYFASNIDCVWGKEGVDNSVAIVDIKTTSKLDEEYLSWQLSIYADLFERQNPHIKVTDLFGAWLRGDIGELVPVKRKTPAEVARLLECEIAGKKYNDETELVSQKSMIVAQRVVDMIIESKELAAYYKEQEKTMTTTLHKAMTEHGVKSWDTELMKATIVPASTSTTFDTTRFKEDYPELYKQYLKETTKGESLRITIRK